MIGIVDYNAGNIKSVQRSLDFIKTPYIVSKNPLELKDADRIIFPGVGEARYAMEQLKKTGFDNFLKDKVLENVPVMGICLGSQIVFDWSEEGNTECLGLIKGKIRHFASVWKERHPDDDEQREYSMLKNQLKIPHMGWNDVAFTNGGSELLSGVPDHSDFYFVHSYVIQPENPEVIKGYADYGMMVPAVVQEKNVTVFQFHPEKSGENGLRILRNFAEK